ncbi:MAG: hypothetical protein QOF89_3749 [Acidobacteriota bacterium]|jgi:hypothetical protein|nr:hypothetical protein [Acidobacteriota bacterium]
MSRKIRCFAAALVLAMLTSGAAQARSSHIRPGSPGFFDALWQWLAGRYAPGLTAIWGKEGSSMDPDGRARPPLVPLPGTDAGGDMGPDGRS